jgi:hypothetical protein
VASHLDDAGDRAAREELAPLLAQLKDALHLDLDSSRAVSLALTRAFLAGLRVGNVETRAHALEHGVLPHFETTSPAGAFYDEGS